MSVAPILRAFATSRWLAPLLLAGCLGGQTGTEGIVENPREGGAGSPTNGEDAACEETEQDVAADDASLGFAFDGVMGFVVGEHDTDLAWSEAPQNVSFGPETGTGSLTIGIDWSGKVKRIHSVPRQDSGGAGPGIAIGCPPDRLAADVTLRLNSGGGALAESVPARVFAASAERAVLSASIPIEQVSGAFRVTLAPGALTRALVIRAAFTELGLAGELSGSIEAQGNGSASVRGVTYAVFPAENPCERSSLQVPVPLTAPGAAELSGFLAALRSEPRPLSWRSGPTTTIGFEVAPVGVACQAGDDGTGSGSGLSLPLALALQTADGRIDTMLAGSVTSNTSGISLRAGRSCEGASVEDQLESCGLEDFEIGARRDLSLSLTAMPAMGGGLRGSIDLFGIPLTDCQPTSMSACGSPGPVSIDAGVF